MDTINVVLGAVLAAALFFITLNPRVDDGPIVRVGSAIAAVGLLGVVLREIGGVDSWIGMRASMRLVFAGALIVFVGVAARHHWFRRSST